MTATVEVGAECRPRHLFVIDKCFTLAHYGRLILMAAVTLSPDVRPVSLLVAAPSPPPANRGADSVVSRLRVIVRQSRRHGIWIAAWSLLGWIGTALAPVLNDQPFVVMMLSPRALFVALASNSVPLLPFVLLGTLRLSVTDASYYIIGRKLPNQFGPRAARSTPATRWKRPIRWATANGDRLCRWFCRRPRLAGAFLFVRPNGKYLGLAGAYGVNSWIAGISATLGTAAFLTAVHVGVATVV